MKNWYCNCWLCSPAKDKKHEFSRKHNNMVKTGLRQISKDEIDSNKVSAYKYLLP